MIQLPYNFPFYNRPWQLDVISDKRKNKVLVIHRRAGKTAVAVNALIYEAHRPENAGKIFHYVFPQKSQAKEAVWKDPQMLFSFLPDELIEKKNEVELTIYLKNKSQIYLKGSDDPDAMRGTNPFGIVLDEYAQMKTEVYNEIYRPILSANGGWIWFIGTPKGKNDFYNKFRFAQEHPEKWQTLMLKASESGIIPAQELVAAKEQLPMQAYNQEFECEFLDGAGTVFRRIKENIKSKFKEPDRGIDYKIGLDLAKYEDFTVITVVDRSTFEVVYIDRFNQIDYNLQKARIEAIARRYNNAPITIDGSSIGDPIAEDLRRTGLQVDNFTFTNESKKSLIENLVVMLEQDQLSLPDYPFLIRELEDFSYTLSPRPPYRVMYSAPQGSHDDCFVEGTLILTETGNRPIENICVGDLVMTRKGFKPVLATRNKIKKVISNIGLTGTPDHPIITTNGEKSLQHVCERDTLFIWNEKQSTIEEKNIIGIRNREDGTCEYIFGDTINGGILHLPFIDKFGLIVMEKFQKVVSFITKMKILLITILKTYNVLLGLNILVDMHLVEASNRVSMQKRIYGTKARSRHSVMNVEKNFTINVLQEQNFVHENVNNETGLNEKRVYNLQVADQPEYFANNILVHNCVISLALAFWKIGGKITTKSFGQEHYGFDFNLRNKRQVSQGGYSKQIFRN